MAGQILLHVGYHKTATTWLQNVYFPGHAGIAVPLGRAELSPAIVRPHAFVFDPAQVRETLMEHVGPACDTGKTVVLSNERFTGNPASGGVDAFEMTERVHRVFPEAKVWLQFREQTAIVNSFYNQFIKQGGTCDVKRFLAPDAPHKRIPHFSLDHFHYLPLLRRFEALFGAEHVLATPFERFTADRDGVLDKVGAFAGFVHDPGVGAGSQRANQSLSDRSVRTLRVLNGLFPHGAAHRHFRPLVRLPGNRVVSAAVARSEGLLGRRTGRIKGEIKRAIGDRFAHSNAALAAHLGMDLSALGYDVATTDGPARRGEQPPTVDA